MNHGKFITPGKDDKEWFLGDTKTISYVVTFAEFTVLLYQEHADPAAGSTISKSVVFQSTGRDNPAMEFDWIVQTYQANLDHSNNFFLWIFNGSNPDEQDTHDWPNVVSPHFLIREKEITSTASTASTTISSTTSTSAPTNTQTNTPPPSVAASNQGTSNTNMVGVGVGVGFGVVLVLGLLAAYLFWWRVKQRAKTAPVAGEDGSDGGPATHHPLMVGGDGGPAAHHSPMVGVAGMDERRDPPKIQYTAEVVQQDPPKAYIGELEHHNRSPEPVWELGPSEVPPYGHVAELGTSRGG